MTQLSKAAFVAKYNNTDDGLYKAGQVGGIGSNDHRSLVDDLNDSVIWIEDLKENETIELIEAADVLTANDTPVDLVPAPGAGKVNIPLYFIISMDYGTTPYDTNVEFAFQYEDGTQVIIDSDFLTASADKVRKLVVLGVDGVINSKIQFVVNTGNPASGDSPIQITTKYRTITI